MSGDHDRPPAPSLAAVPFRLAGISSRLAPLGPRHGVDDKPGLHDLQYMSYTGEDGRDVHFRLMDQLKPHWRRLAIGLKFPQNEIAIMENKDDPVYYLFSEWLRGANQEKDPRPVTWRTLIEALQHANVQEEATILKKHFIQVPVIIPNAAAAAVVKSDEGMSTSSLSSSATTAITASELIHSPPSQPAELSSDATAEIETNRKVVEELHDLVSDYSLMLTKFKRLLSGCDVSDARFYLKNMLSTDVFTSCDNIEQLLNRLCHCYVDTFNVYYLQKLATRYFERDDVSKLVKQYNEKKNKFLKETMVLDFHKAIKSKAKDLPEGMARITIRIPRELATNRILKDMEELAIKAFGDKYYNQLVHFHVIAGSVVICWFVVESLCEVLQRLAREKVAVWRQYGVEEVMVGSQCVYCKKEYVFEGVSFKMSLPEEIVELRAKAESKKKLIVDVIHRDMEFHPVLMAFIDTPQLQRLRHIKQLGGVCYVFPTAADTCFEHALGCSHLAGLLIRNLQRKQPELHITDAEVLCVQIAALCHDLGHGPFSHVFQRFVTPFLQVKWDRIEWAVKMFDELLKNNSHVKDICQVYKIDIDGDHGTLVRAMIVGGDLGQSADARDELVPLLAVCADRPYFLEIVRNRWSGFDVCMMDSVTRDSNSTVMNAAIEWRRFIEYARVINGHICTRAKAAGNLVDMLEQRRKLYTKAYYHKTVRMIEYKISLALLAAKDEKVILKSDGSRASIVEAIEGDMDAFTRLNDSVLFQLFECCEAAEIVKEIELRGGLRSMKFITCAANKGPESRVSVDMDGFRQTFSQELASACGVKIPDDPVLKPTTQQPFWVDFVIYDYCLENKDPFELEIFYNRENPDVAITEKREQIRRSLPAHFHEIELNVYSTSQEHHALYERNKENFDKKFKEVCKKLGFIETI